MILLFICVSIGCIEPIEQNYPLETHTGFVEDVDYIPESFFCVPLTIVTFNDGEVIILRGIIGIPQQRVIAITYYKKDWNNRPYYKFVGLEDEVTK